MVKVKSQAVLAGIVNGVIAAAVNVSPLTSKRAGKT